MVLLKRGQLEKEPRKRHAFSRPHRRDFVLTDDFLEWHAEPHAPTAVPRGRLPIQGARVWRSDTEIMVESAGEVLVLRGDDLDAWEQALQAACLPGGEVQQLRQQLAEREAENRRLREQLAGGEAENRRLREQLAECGGSSRAAVAWEPFRALLGGEAAAGREAEAGKFGEGAEDLTKQLADRDAAIKVLRAQLASRDAQLAKSRDTIRELEARLADKGDVRRAVAAWEPFKALLGGKGAGREAEAGKFGEGADFLRHFQFGQPDEFLHGLAGMATIRRSMEEECRDNDGGKW